MKPSLYECERPLPPLWHEDLRHMGGLYLSIYVPIVTFVFLSTLHLSRGAARSSIYAPRVHDRISHQRTNDPLGVKAGCRVGIPSNCFNRESKQVTNPRTYAALPGIK